MRINIQSFSDIITNSSSEIFCTINGNRDIINTVYSILERLFSKSEDSDLEPVITHNLYSDNIDSINLSLPHSMSNCTDFYKAGIEAILGKNNLLDNINIQFEDE